MPNEIYNFGKIFLKTCLTFGVGKRKQIIIRIENKEQGKEKYYLIMSKPNEKTILGLTDSLEGISLRMIRDKYHLEEKLSYLGQVSVFVGNDKRDFKDFSSFLDAIEGHKTDAKI